MHHRLVAHIIVHKMLIGRKSICFNADLRLRQSSNGRDCSPLLEFLFFGFVIEFVDRDLGFFCVRIIKKTKGIEKSEN